MATWVAGSAEGGVYGGACATGRVGSGALVRIAIQHTMSVYIIRSGLAIGCQGRLRLRLDISCS
jgi:hypothetical protein